MGWRLIDTEVTDPFYVTAVDEAISIARKEKNVPNTLHLYTRHPAAVSVGRSKKIHDDIYVDECQKNNVKIVRRTTGGGTIFTDKNCLIYSLVFNKKCLMFSSPKKIFGYICNSLASGLKKYDINTIYKPPNDLLLNGKKISGSSQILKGNIILLHGTLLIDTDLELMNNVLKKPTNYNVSTICRETNKIFKIDQAKEILKKEFEVTFNTEFEKTELSIYELKLIKKLLKDRYHNDNWNYLR
jgi:lipoate-protein ligase A